MSNYQPIQTINHYQNEINTNISSILQDLDTYNDISGVHKKNLDNFIDHVDKRKDQINNTLLFSSDMDRNQKYINHIISNENDIINSSLNSQEIYDLNRETEIYLYYYKRNKAQYKILYLLFFVIIIILVLTIINNKFNFILNNSIYIILIGFIISCYIIFFVYQMYDLYIRNNYNYDEYDYYHNKNDLATELRNINPSKVIEKKEEDEEKKCK